ncbi:hypothetical protein [Hymenobacter jejuensis]|uniref:Uncharacterized protein n=1 Tax=Hymenobacter jejuensis TaxID=2502781 RepID=A0A5B7ZYU7_9BACT|nr:hypothetical protein [Hymenobacter jejuensis]QDA60381.1 hypothetical protein FHG12_09790 [Hymenobacter jejuensis]
MRHYRANHLGVLTSLFKLYKKRIPQDWAVRFFFEFQSMSLLHWRLCGTLLVLLLTGCRSEKSAFFFRQPLPQAGAVAHVPIALKRLPPALPEAAADAKSHLTTRNNVARSGHKTLIIRNLPTRVSQKRFALTFITAPSLPRKYSAATGHHSAASAAKHEKLHLLLGLGLTAAGIVLGLLLGGWAGLVVGVLIVGLGYYFLGLAFGGSHAWQEIFQEIFNL